jgi:hypothetical protein
MIRKACAALLLLTAAALVWQSAPANSPQKATTPESTRTVYFATGLSDIDALVYTSAIAAAEPNNIALLNSPAAIKATVPFLAALKPKSVVPVGSADESADELSERLHTKLSAPVAWADGKPDALWRRVYSNARTLVVVESESRRLVLHAACLAGELRAPLVVIQDAERDVPRLKKRITAFKTKEVYAVGDTADLLNGVESVRVIPLANAAAVASAYTRELAKAGPIRNIVVTNPADTTEERGGMSVLAPSIALQRRAALVLTNDEGSDATASVKKAIKNPDLARADTLIVLANLRAIPVEKRPNPVPGKDANIEMEPMTPSGDEPFTFGIGRLFHEDPAMLALVLARQALLPEDGTPRKALVVSNPGGGLPLLETFSRHTARELRNAGYQTTAMFENDAEKDEVRKLLPAQDIFLWEGHYKTLTDEFGFLTWNEPLPPSLCFLQSCLALKEEEALPLFSRGAIGIVGSSTRTFSGTGGAFTLAYFDALLYENQTLGGALRQAKNYLLAYSMLKEKRLGAAAKLTGVNVRSAWAFSLWGDPTLRLPHPARPKEARDAVSHEFRGKTLVINLPNATYDKVKVSKYEAEMRPNARLAGLLRMSTDNEDLRQLVPFVFAEVRLPEAPPGKTPHLSGRLSNKQWVFVWDDRRKSGYLLITPRKENHELHFKIDYDEKTDPVQSAQGEQ